jgi:hypothetical protein
MLTFAHESIVMQVRYSQDVSSITLDKIGLALDSLFSVLNRER